MSSDAYCCAATTRRCTHRPNGRPEGKKHGYRSVGIADHIGTITLNHKEKLNALSTELVEGVISALDEFRRGKARVVVLRAKPGAKVGRPGTMSGNCR